MKGREFYKKDEEFIAETTLGPKEFRNAKNKLISLGILTAKAKGVPPKTHYILHEEVYFKLISDFDNSENKDDKINFAKRRK